MKISLVPPEPVFAITRPWPTLNRSKGIWRAGQSYDVVEKIALTTEWPAIILGNERVRAETLKINNQKWSSKGRLALVNCIVDERGAYAVILDKSRRWIEIAATTLEVDGEAIVGRGFDDLEPYTIEAARANVKPLDPSIGTMILDPEDPSTGIFRIHRRKDTEDDLK